MTKTHKIIYVLPMRRVVANKLPNNIPASAKPDPKAAQALQEGLGGQFGEMRTMMQYLFQNNN
jgi:Mn-containing catalase